MVRFVYTPDDEDNISAVEFVANANRSLDALLEVFRSFALAIGYSKELTDKIDFIDDEGESDRM